MARFLVATMPIPGHVAPIAPVVAELVRRGHSVLWYTSSHFARQVEAAGAVLRPIVSTLDYGDSAYDRHFPRRVGRTGLRRVTFDLEHLFLNPVEGYLRDLRDIVSSWAPDAVVTDPAVAAGAVLEQIDGLPVATINVTVLGLQSPRGAAPFGTGLPPAAGVAGYLRNRSLSFVLDRTLYLRLDRAYRAVAIRNKWPVGQFRPRVGRYLYLQPSIPELEYKVDPPPQVHFIGALLPTPTPPGEVRPSWLSDVAAARTSGQAVVLVTQGTVATDPLDLIVPTLRALEHEDVLVVAASVNPDALPPLPANARAAGFIPFDLLMPMVDAYITNGGFGGFMMAMTHGVPVLCSGTSEDKAEVGARVAYAGVGINLKKQRPSRAELRKALERLLGPSSYRKQALLMRSKLAAYQAVPTAAGLLEQLAETQAPVYRNH